jgi:hypothetical protein
MDVTVKSNHRVAAVLALAVLAFVPAPAGAGHNPDLIPKAPGAEFRVLSLRLFEAAQKGETEMVVQFLAEGAPVEGVTASATPPCCWPRAGRTKAVKVLLEAGSEIDHQNLRGSTALLHAAIASKNRTVKALVAAAYDTATRAISRC